MKSRRGTAFGDIANNGNIDIVILNVGEPPSLLLNTSKNTNHRVLFKLVGTKSNRAAIGARVTIHAGGVTQFDEVRGGGSYLSQNDLRLHFGLGTTNKIDSVELRWPSDKLERFKTFRLTTFTQSSSGRESKTQPRWHQRESEAGKGSPLPGRALFDVVSAHQTCRTTLRY